MSNRLVAVIFFGFAGCVAGAPREAAVVPEPARVSRGVAPPAATASAAACGSGTLRIHFYDVAQALAALVDLPNGRHVLVDTGDAANRRGCGAPCQDAHASLMTKLAADLGGRPIDLLFITHPHSDHVGGAVDVIDTFSVAHYVDNGRDLAVGEIDAPRRAAARRGVKVSVVEPGQTALPLASSDGLGVRAIAPSSWLPACKENRNLCSILLRVDYCASSVLFAGDAEAQEEEQLDVGGAVGLLQVGHHGSDTSSSPRFLAAARPHYAVISAGKTGEGQNRTYCHPRASTVQRLSSTLGGAGDKKISAFDARVSCAKAEAANWIDVPASDRLWATERDGDVVLSTRGDGNFVRE